MAANNDIPNLKNGVNATLNDVIRDLEGYLITGQLIPKSAKPMPKEEEKKSR